MEKRAVAIQGDQSFQAASQPKSPIQLALENRIQIPNQLAAGLELQTKFDQLTPSEKDLLTKVRDGEFLI